MHYPVTLDLLNEGFNVLVEKPFGRSRYECDELIKIAGEQGVTLAVFQQTFLAPFYEFVYDTVKSGKLGEVKQIGIRYNGFARRWDWQTISSLNGGELMNTAPHPLDKMIALWDMFGETMPERIFSKLAKYNNSGDAEDFVKVVLEGKGHR